MSDPQQIKTTDLRLCTCYPSEAPVPCQHKYAHSDCVSAAEAQPKTTVRRVRILVVIDPDGKWEAVGSYSWTDAEARKEADDLSGDLGAPPWGYHWIEADVPVPVQQGDTTIESAVSNAQAE